MANVRDLEARRVELQSALDADRSAEERNRLGQFATPPRLARQVASLALHYLGKKPIRFLDPSIGSGAFYSALRALYRWKKPAASGVELDPRFVHAARRLWADDGLVVIEGDFTKIPPPVTDAARATLVLANPPYVRHHHLERDQKLELQQRAERTLRTKVSGLAGLYVFFMLLAHEWMAGGGVAAWLIPSEWMDVNYGTALKEYLCSRVTLLRVHRFDAADVQFGDALVSSAVVFFRKARPTDDTTCDFTFGSLTEPQRSRRVVVARLRSAPKWSHYFHGRESNALPRGGPRVALGELFAVKRGIATGGNDFFIRPHDEFRAMGIPERFLRPVLPSSRYLTTDVIERRSDGYPDIEVPLALLDCALSEGQVRASCPKLWNHLESERAHVVRSGYLTSRRHPWYSQEQRAHAPVVVTYMGRGRNGEAPFRFFWNRSDATATNVYLLLIPKHTVIDALHHEPQLGKVVVDFLRSVDPEQLVGHGRVYGGGLHKLEPKELGRLDATPLVERLELRIDRPREQLALAFAAR